MSHRSPDSPRIARRAMIYAAVFVLFVAGLGATACAPPTVNLRQANLTKITTTGFAVAMNLSIFNPNMYSVPLNSVEWKLDLFNRAFTNGVVRTREQIGAGATSSVNVPLGVRFKSVSLGVKNFMNGRDIPWALSGRCNFQTPVGPVYVAYARGGTWANPLKGKRLIGQHHHHTIAPKLDVQIAAIP